MKVLVAVVVATIVVPLWDWAAMAREDLYSIKCDYQYWPLSKSRIASVILLFIAVTVTGVLAGEGLTKLGMSALIFAYASVVIHTAVGLWDVMAQNRRGYRAPPPSPRYSDPRP